jgi:hypothetical protein
MKITNTHFILGAILFVVIMISLTTSCCDFMPYSRPRGSLGMSVYEGMEDEKEKFEGKKEGLEDEKEKFKATQEGMEEGLEDEKEKFEGKKEGLDDEKEKFKGDKEGLDDEKEKFKGDKEGLDDEKEKKEGFGNFGVYSNNSLGGGNTGRGRAFGGTAIQSFGDKAFGGFKGAGSISGGRVLNYVPIAAATTGEATIGT